MLGKARVIKDVACLRCCSGGWSYWVLGSRPPLDDDIIQSFFLFNRFAHSAGPCSLCGWWLGCLFCPLRLSSVFCLCWFGCGSAVLLCCCLAGLLFCCLVGLLSCRLARKTKTKTWGEKKSKDNKKTSPNKKKRQKSTQTWVREG